MKKPLTEAAEKLDAAALNDPSMEALVRALRFIEVWMEVAEREIDAKFDFPARWPI